MPVVKGGVWSNVEDEILKASVSKYGLNQWQRVSSLLARKSAKQCKARWNEWLDPSIKKVEFSREEDEKLLHMAKLFPTQWRTIAQTVGRTATQCLDRYQKLLDEAEAREGAELGLEGPEGGETAAPSADDVRKFRPGEMDPDPETKPARPDAIDMDEDEKEMLSEARARLANTQGKKAKRKARERLLEDSRRLAVLQKRRELKHAGINIKLVHRKKGEMDYNADIPFEKQPALGFYDTHEEEERNEKQRLNFDPRKAQTNAKRRTDQDEDKDDRKRRKGDKPGSAAAFASAAKAGQMQKIREAEQLSKRRALNLPAPQVGEAELEEIVKMGIIGESANRLAAQSQNESTMGLVGDYSKLTASTPIRTPMQPAKEDTLRNEIQNLRALTETQSSLFGGENTPLHTSATTGFDGAAPRKHVVATPNPLAAAATPLRPGMPMGAPGATPMRTPRDTLGMNQGGGFGDMTGMTPRDLKIREIENKNKLKNAFASLPKPKATEDDFEFEIADENEESTSNEPTQEEDAEERDRRLREAREAEERAEFKRRTAVIQRSLPRPTDLNIDSLFTLAESQSQTEIDRLINLEAAKLMSSDARRYPLPGSKVSGVARPLEKLDDSVLERARIEMVMELPKEILALVQKDFIDAWNHVHNAIDTLPGLSGYGDDDIDVDQLKTQAFDTAMTALQTTAVAANTLEKKLSLHYTGYIKRSNMLRTKIVEANNAIVEAKRELDTYMTLKIGEENAISRRIEKLTREVELVEGREREEQQVYRKRKEEYEEMVALARGMGLTDV